ncbi:MAG: translation initiation factor IF-2 subunit alpha [Candidatus Bilamarchaeaceae archaeon]
MEFPEENELVIAVIKKIVPYGAFCTLLEYGNLEAFLHISEIAPRWIKNIHEFVSEGQRVVAKVHHVDKEKRQVDISLKRVTEEEKRKKLEQVNFERRAERLIEVAISGIRGKKPALDEIKKKIVEEYGALYPILKEVAEKGEEPLEALGFSKQFQTKLVEVVRKNIKKPTVTTSGIITLICYGGNGISLIKNALGSIRKEDGVDVLYLGAPRYKIVVIAEDYKAGEKKLTNAVKLVEDFAKKHGCHFEFRKEESG